jgi:hypothetical protein
MEIYRIVIQDGENTYYEYSETKPDEDYVDGFVRAVKDIIPLDITQEELEVLRKFNIV